MAPSKVFLGLAGLVLLLLGGLAPSHGASEASAFNEERKAYLQELNLADLLVTSVSKKPENLFEANAAVSLISHQELQRTGIRRLPEAMALVPGMEAARINGNRWAISSRGFNGNFANKLLVLIDGRAVYSPAFSGVYWDDQNILIEDIDRIEIIRGPGGTMWGANAVNGVINVITRDARETLGTYATTGYGMEEQGFLAVRHGFSLKENGFVRAYANLDHYDALTRGGHDAGDELFTGGTGFRSDWHQSDSQLTFQGDYRYGKRDEIVLVPSPAAPFSEARPFDLLSRGGNLLFRYTRYLGDQSDWQIQAYWDHWQRSDAQFDYQVDTFDVEFQQRFPLGDRQQWMYGFGYRYQPDHVEDDETFISFFSPARRNFQLWSGFLQDEITLVEEKLELTLGSKFEHNDYTQFEIQPSARLTLTPTPRQTIWAAVSRAVRTPSRTENDIRLGLVSPLPGAVFPVGFGQPGFEEETLLSYELGYRVKPTDQLRLDIAAFYSSYRDLLVGESGPIRPGPIPGSVTVPILAANGGEADTYGLETEATWELQPWWKLRGGHTFLNFAGESPRGEWSRSPKHQLFLRSSFDLGPGVKLDLWGRYKDRVSAFGLSSFADLDARIAWSPVPALEIALVGRNLIRPQRREFAQAANFAALVSENQRTLFGQLTYRF